MEVNGKDGGTLERRSDSDSRSVCLEEQWNIVVTVTSRVCGVTTAFIATRFSLWR